LGWLHFAPSGASHRNGGNQHSFGFRLANSFWPIRLGRMAYMPASQPTPVLAVIAAIALVAMAGSVYIGVTAQMSAGQPPAAAASEPAP
jgi:hypothetical protein